VLVEAGFARRFLRLFAMFLQTFGRPRVKIWSREPKIPTNFFASCEYFFATVFLGGPKDFFLHASQVTRLGWKREAVGVP
jgi:hypothetical protein